MDEDIPAYSTDHRLEEQLKSVQKYLKELNLKIQISSAPSASWPNIPKTTVDRNTADRTFDSCRHNIFMTSAKNTWTTQKNTVHST